MRRPITALTAALLAIGVTGALATPAAAGPVAPVGQGFTVTPSDLSFILKQIKIAEAHVRNTTSATGPCGALVGPGPDQIASPLVSYGLRTVDGSCNNLIAGQETFGAAGQVFPRRATPVFQDAEPITPAFPVGPPGPTSYKQKSPGNTVVDSQPRVISNLVVDQTSTNPAAVAAAGRPVRTQGNQGVFVCGDPQALPPPDCVPPNETLFIPNVTTDVGLSPPFNSLFTIFGQFFDHGVDQTVKGGGTVFVPLKADDPLVAGPDRIPGNADDPQPGNPRFVPPSQRFMVLTRATNQPGTDNVLGTADDVQDATNTDSPWVDQSQTYTSHPSHQVFLREYELNTNSRPVATGKLIHSTDGGMGTWALVKAQAASKLGLQLSDRDVVDIPMIAADPYGNFLPGPVRGMPQYVTASGMVEGDLASPVAVPANVLHFNIPFLTDIAHNADPSPQDTDHNPTTPPVAPTPDADTVASADFASQPAGTYDDEMLNAHFIAGDGRVNENIALTAVHQIFHSEHDRLVDDIRNTLSTDTSTSGAAALLEWQKADGAGGWNGERLFQAARFVTEMEYQHLVFEEFARKVQPAINPFEPFAFTQTELNPAVKAEFAHAVYRFGHSMLTETIPRINENGSHNDISLLNGFLNPPAYDDSGTAVPLTSQQAGGAIIMGLSDQVGNEIDEFVTDTLRNNLLGLPLDLPTINMTRARSEGIPSLNVLRRQLFASTNDGQLKPYISWVDFGENIKHPESLTNFVAAYGRHPTILSAPDLAARRAAARAIVNPDSSLGDVPPADAAAFMNSTDAWANNGTTSITGLDNVDLWVGGLAEVTVPFGGLLGTTFNFVFENQLTDLQNGDRLYYLARTPGMNLRQQLEGNSFAELVMRNTTAHTLKADAFATADCKFQLSNLAGTEAGFAASGNTVANDPASECNEVALLIRMPDGTIQYRARNSVDPPGINGQSVYNGTAGVDRVYGGNDNDTFWGNENDDRIEGGGGADVALGGAGRDIITDLAGDDVLKGGPGNDAIDAGPGLDIIISGAGKDFTNGGANANETFGGEGDDFMILGQSLDAAFGDSGDDWEEGGDQPDLMQGDSGNLFFLDNSQMPGHDILIGQGGDDDYDMEGGDDIGVSGPGIEKVAGASGYDWEIGLSDPQPQDLDLALPIVNLDILPVDVRDKFNESEALSGWKFDDKIRGDSLVPAQVGGAGFIGCDALDQAGLDRISGLDALVPPLDTPLASVVAASASKSCPVLSGANPPGANVWGAGNILLGGAGSDLIEGRGADDVIDGDKYLNVRLSVRTDPANPASEIGSTDLMENPYLPGNPKTLQQAVFAGEVDPGNIVAVREILSSPAPSDVDTAVFSGPRADYDITFGADFVTVAHARGAATDGTDTVRNVEKLQFSDQTVNLAVPGAPTIGTATAGVASATVNWTAPTGTVFPAISGYSVRVVDGANNQVGALRPAPANATSLTITGLTNGTTYRFQVAAVNAVGTGPFSALSNAVTPAADTVAPTVIARNPVGNATGVPVAANITATFSENVTGVSGTTVTLRNPANALIPATVTYNAGTRVVTLDPNANLANNTLYTASLAGGPTGIKDLAGNPLATVTWTFRTGTVPGAPVAFLPASGPNGGALTASVMWVAPGNTGSSPITGYRVTATPAVGAPVVSGVVTGGTGVIKSLSMTLPAGNYRFTVVAINVIGAGPPSAPTNPAVAAR